MNYVKREPVRIGAILTAALGVLAIVFDLDPKLVGSLVTLIGVLFGTAVRSQTYAAERVEREFVAKG